MEDTIRSIETRRKKLSSDIDEVGSPDRMAKLVAEVEGFVSTAKPLVADLKKGVQTGYATDAAGWTGVPPSENAEPVDEARGRTHAVWAASAAVVIVDAGCAALLGAFSFNLAMPAAIAIGIFLSLTVCLVTAAIWRGTVVVDISCPGKAVRPLRRQMKILGPLYLGCLMGALLLGRLVSLATSTGAAAFVSLLTALSVLGPMLSASMISLADLISWARSHSFWYRKLTKLELAIDELDQAARRHGGQRGQKPPMALVAAVTLLLLICGTDVSASECGSLWFDSSRSVAAPDLQQAASAALANLPNWAGSSGCDTWALYAFAGASFTDVPFDTFKMPLTPTGVCRAQPPANELSVIFRGPADAAENERHKRCETSRAAELRIYQSAIAAQVTQAGVKLAALKPVAPGRTCIVDLLHRLRDSNTTRLALVVTDGSETCLTSFRGPIPAPVVYSDVVMIVVSPENLPKTSSPGQYFVQTRDRWRSVAPWLINILPASRIDERTFLPESGRK